MPVRALDFPQQNRQLGNFCLVNLSRWYLQLSYFHHRCHCCHRHHHRHPQLTFWSLKLIFHRAVPPEFQSLVSVEGGEVVYSSINNNIVNILFFNNAHLKSQKMILVFDYPPALQGGEGEWGRCKFCHALAFKGQIVSQVLFHLVFTMFFLFLFLIIIRLPDAGRE